MSFRVVTMSVYSATKVNNIDFIKLNYKLDINILFKYINDNIEYLWTKYGFHRQYSKLSHSVIRYFDWQCATELLFALSITFNAEESY